jgi:NAD/NADP transhydrogenase beta subunit
MKTVVWIVVGLVIAALAWVPLNLTDPRDIPFIPAILAIVGSFVGGVIVLVAVVQWVRHGSARS